MSEELNNQQANNDNNPQEQGEQQKQPEESVSDIDRLRGELEEARKSAETLRDQLLRKAAEFENYKRRTESDSLNLIRNANEGLIISLIPILNDFIRSLKSGRELKDFDSFYKGVELIHAKLSKVLENHGLVPFDSPGKPFDVDYHDALLQIPRDDVPPHTVIEEVERGYMLNDKVLRHAKVIVSAPAVGKPEPQDAVKDGSAERED